MFKVDPRPTAFIVPNTTLLGRSLAWTFAKLGRHTQPYIDPHGGQTNRTLLFLITTKQLLKYSQECEAKDEEANARALMKQLFAGVQHQRAAIQQATQATKRVEDNIYSMEDFRLAHKARMEEAEVGHPPSASELSSDEPRLYEFDPETKTINFTLPAGQRVNTTLAELLTEYEDLLH